MKRSKRKTRDRTESSASRTSSSSEHQTKVVKKLSKTKEVFNLDKESQLTSFNDLFITE